MSSTPSAQKPVSRIRVLYSWGRKVGRSIIRCFEAVGKGFKKTGKGLSTFFRWLWRGKLHEEKKVALRKSIGRVLLRCCVHLLSMAATATLAYFNLAGYYIGAYLSGLSTHVYQAFDVLCLQVTAKLLVCPLHAILVHILIVFRNCLLSVPLVQYSQI